MPVVLKSGSLNLLEPSGPVQAYNGIALTFLPLPLSDLVFSFKKFIFMQHFSHLIEGVVGSERTDKPVVGGALFRLLSQPTDIDGVIKPHNVTQAVL